MVEVSVGGDIRAVLPLAGDSDQANFGSEDPPSRAIWGGGGRTYAGRAMKALLRSATVTTFAILVVTACGQATQAQAETPAQIWHELVQCARAHGDPTLPDPTIDSQGRAKFPPGTQPPSQATQQACQSIYNRLPAAARSGNSAPDIQMELRFAACMRQQGLTDWPDPDANGDYPLPPDLITTSKSGPIWDRIKAAWDACRAYNPSGSISVSHT